MIRIPGITLGVAARTLEPVFETSLSAAVGASNPCLDLVKHFSLTASERSNQYIYFVRSQKSIDMLR